MVRAAPDGDADAHVTGHVPEAEDVGPVDRVQHAPRHAHRRLGVRVADEHCELVAAEPRGEILGANGAAEAARELGEQLVARAVAPGVVDRLEAVEVEVENGRRSGAVLELLLHRFEQVEPIGQAGEARRGTPGGGAAP